MDYIKIQNLSYQVKNKVILDDINLVLDKHQCTALVGHNGSGKTTLGKHIVGILQPTNGEVLVDNINVGDLKLYEIGKKIGYLFQNPERQIFAPTVYEEIEFASKFNEVSEREIENKVEEILKAFDLSDKKSTKTYNMSQGEKQRVALATIMLMNPEYLVLDEPTTGLDTTRKEEFGKLLDGFIENGIGVLLISHDRKFISEHATRVVEMKAGKIAYEK